MGKKRIVTQQGGGEGTNKRSSSKTPKKRLSSATIHIQSTFNNTKILLADNDGNALAWSSSGALGFKGAKKGTPFASGKIANLIAEKAEAMGVKNIDIIVKGVGAGRESAIRTIGGRGFDIGTIRDMTPVPFNGPRAKKARRV
jgi:small subunit ribosomal protein S11